MPSYKLGDWLNSQISVHFPGGREAFVKAGGEAAAVVVPRGKDLAYILVPAATQQSLDLTTFRKKLSAVCARKRIELRIVDTPVYGGMTPMEFKDEIMAVVMAIALIGVFPEETLVAVYAPVFIVTINGGKLEAEVILNYLRKSKRVARAVVVMTKGCIEAEFEVEAPAAKEEAPITPKVEATMRDTVITKDEVTDLTIALENAQTVEDFLKSI